MYPVRLTPRFSQRAGAAICAAGAGLWLLLLVVSPYTVSRGPATSLAGIGQFTYRIGAAVCHQRPERSFHAWGVQLPVCGRCFGLYAAAVAGALWAAARAAGRGKPAKHAGVSWRCWLIAAALPTAASVGLEVAGVWSQSPAIRAAAAIPLGFTVAWFVAAHGADVCHAFLRRA